jgi:hypothetical protein
MPTPSSDGARRGRTLSRFPVAVVFHPPETLSIARIGGVKPV